MMRDRGYSAHVHQSFPIGTISQKIEQDSGCGPITIVGYSSGADAACLACRRLEQSGIRVDTLILIESTMGVAVPGNVHYCFNIFKSNPATDWIPVLRGLPVVAQGCTQLHNVDVRCNSQFASFREHPHLKMATAPDVQEFVASLIDARHGCSQACQAPQVRMSARGLTFSQRTGGSGVMR